MKSSHSALDIGIKIRPLQLASLRQAKKSVRSRTRVLQEEVELDLLIREKRHQNGPRDVTISTRTLGRIVREVIGNEVFSVRPARTIDLGLRSATYSASSVLGRTMTRGRRLYCDK